MENYVVADFSAEKESEIWTEPLYQWDYGQRIIIKGIDLTSVLEIHFFQLGVIKAVRIAPNNYIEDDSGGTSDEDPEETTEDDSDTAEIVDGDIVVYIPNVFLENASDIDVYVYLTEENIGKTVKKAVVRVKERPQPDEYIREDQQEEVGNIYEAIVRAGQRAEAAADAAEQSAIDARQAYDDMEVIDDVIEDDPRPVSSGGIYDVLQYVSGSYNSLQDKPQINGVELMGDLSFEDLGDSAITQETIVNTVNTAFAQW